MEVPDLLNQRLKWVVVHYQPHEATAGGLSFGRNLLGMGPPAAVRAPFHIRSGLGVVLAGEFRGLRPTLETAFLEDRRDLSVRADFARWTGLTGRRK